MLLRGHSWRELRDILLLLQQPPPKAAGRVPYLALLAVTEDCLGFGSGERRYAVECRTGMQKSS